MWWNSELQFGFLALWMLCGFFSPTGLWNALIKLSSRERRDMQKPESNWRFSEFLWSEHLSGIYMKLPRLSLIYCQCTRQSTCLQGTDGLMEEDYQVNGYCFRTALLGNVKVSYFSSEIHSYFPTVVVCPWLLMRGLISISILNLFCQ